MLEQGKRYAGGCLCGAVRYEIVGPSLFEAQCCCRDCQKATGTGHTTIIGVHGSQLALGGETPRAFTNTGESGGRVTRHFCANCGGRIYTSGDHPGQLVMVQAGSLDDPNAVTPTEVIYHADAVAWDAFKPGMAIFEKYPPPNPKAMEAAQGRYDGPSVDQAGR
jgi:hypothetical protein